MYFFFNFKLINIYIYFQEIIYNPNANPEDKEYFQNLLMEVQVLGNKYYAQLMSLGAGGQQQYGMPGMPGQKQRIVFIENVQCTLVKH